MPFISSPVTFPPSSSPPAELRKRRFEDSTRLDESKKQKRVVGGFIDDDDEEENDLNNLHDAQLRSEFALIDQLPLSQDISPPNLSFSGPTLSQVTDLSDQNDHYSGASLGVSQVEAGKTTFSIKTCGGKVLNTRTKEATTRVSYESLVAGRSTTAPGKAQRSYYGIDIHKLLDDVAKEEKSTEAIASAQRSHENMRPSIETTDLHRNGKKHRSLMWTEKYRARKFGDLIGDERTHRSVLRWLKGWDPIVFPGLSKSSKKNLVDENERAHRKILLLTGPPGLGKTTLAHVCAKQAGYEVLEINASDDRSKDVVKGRIRDAVGTENVRSVNVETNGTKVRRAGRPVCVVVDEVDGVVGGSGASGEGGFIKALIDLVALDQKNSAHSISSQNSGLARKKKGDSFRLLRPLILICNDVYHPSLRPLRTSNVAEIIHVRHVALENVVQRMKNVFEKEGILVDNDGVRKLCEAAWGLSSRKDRTANHRGTVEGDIRSVLVTGEWIAHKLRMGCSSTDSPRLTKVWLEQNIFNDTQNDGSSSRGLGRGGVREIVERVFVDGAGFGDVNIGSESFADTYAAEKSKTPVGVADLRKRHAIKRLREMVDTSGEYDRCITDCFITYPTQTYQDDTFLSKPNLAYEWLDFHDMVSTKVFTNQDWELNPYLSQSVVAFHHLFASSARQQSGKNKYDPDPDQPEEEHPFSGPRADFIAHEAHKQNQAILTGFQSSFSAPLSRLFRSVDSVATDLIPNLLRMLSPDIKPVVVRGSGDQKSVASVRKESERALVQSAVRVMSGLNVTFEKARVENEGGAHGGWIYRMEP